MLNRVPLIYMYLSFISRFSANAYNSILISRFSAVDGYHFRLLIEQMKPKDENKKSLLYVPTASYAISKLSTKSLGEQRRRARYDAKQKMKLLKEAFKIDKTTMLELDDPKLRSEQIERELTNAGIIYVEGGNTFYLQMHILRTQFWELAEKSLSRGCIYLGCSAGAIVAGRSISTAYWKGWDEPDVGVEWNDETLRGRQLVDFDIFPHYDAHQHKELVESRKSSHLFNVVTVSDNMALVHSTQDGVVRNFEFYADGALANVVIRKVDNTYHL